MIVTIPHESLVVCVEVFSVGHHQSICLVAPYETGVLMNSLIYTLLKYNCSCEQMIIEVPLSVGTSDYLFCSVFFPHWNLLCFLK